ncbi:MAG: type IIL restriction-modification enzyme MmeI, partial [Anditalea sp.]
MGGQKLSGTFGDNFLEFIQYQFYPIGAVDLVTYFFRRSFDIIKERGFQSLISTNTIAQGKARKDGLDIILKQGGNINHAIKSMKWPGIAAVEVALVTVTKQYWNGIFVLGGRIVDTITTYLDNSEEQGNPFKLKMNEGKSFQGSIVLGKGFILDPDRAQSLIAKDPRNKDVLFPFLNGDDLNNNYDQSPSRWVINFHDWSEEKAKTYSDCYEILERLVKPDRIAKKGDRGAEFWWQFLRIRKELYQSITPFKNVLVIPETTKYLTFAFCPTDIVFSHANKIIVTDEFDFFSILKSSIHLYWVWKNSSTLESRMKYITSDAFEIFPFPINLKIENKQSLNKIGEDYYEYRKKLTKELKLGFTKTYNSINNGDIFEKNIDTNLKHLDKKTIEEKFGKETWNFWNHLQKTEGTCLWEEAVNGIVRLRELHKEMDVAVLEAYGWTDIQLRHDFYEVDYLPENDRVRYTIHPDARKQILKRLLELNHLYFEEEAKQGLHKQKDVEAFYEQKGQPIPEDVAKWFKKGKGKARTT